MIGAEFADRVSPAAGFRSAMLVPNGSEDCWACGAPFTACQHSDFAASEVTDAERVRLLATQRGQAQTKRPTGRPPGRPAKPKEPFSEKVVEPAPVPEVAPVAAEVPLAPEPAVGTVVPAEAVVAPVGSSPTEVEAVPGEAAVAPPVAPQGPIGADFGGGRVETLSPVAPEVAAAGPATVPRVSAADIPAGDPAAYSDQFEVPPGRMSPDDDPFRPDAVLVSDPSQIGATGAWLTLPGGVTAALTKEVQLVSWQDGTKNPMYRLLGAVGAVIPRPMV